MIIGISGRIGSGKDTVGKIIQDLTKNSYDQSPWKIKKFAGKLKQIVSLLTGIPVEDLERQEVKDSVLGPEWNKLLPPLPGKPENVVGEYRPYTVRELLQRIGTEAMRDQIHPQVWVNALFNDYKQHSMALTSIPPINVSESKWLITDVRFPNEAQAIKDRGGIVIRVSRGHPKENEHTSETALDNYLFDVTIDNNGTLEDLTEKIGQVLIDHNL